MGMGRLLAHPIISRIPPISALNPIEHCRKTSTIVNLAKLWAELGLKLMHDCLLLRSTSRSCRFADSLASESDARTAWGIAESSNQPILGIQLRVSWEETSSEDTWYTCHDTLVIHGTYLGVMILLFKPRSVPSFSLVFPWFLHVFFGFLALPWVSAFGLTMIVDKHLWYLWFRFPTLMIRSSPGIYI